MKKTKPQTKKRLAVQKEALRELSSSTLSVVAGGGTAHCQGNIDTRCCPRTR